MQVCPRLFYSILDYCVGTRTQHVRMCCDPNDNERNQRMWCGMSLLDDIWDV